MVCPLTVQDYYNKLFGTNILVSPALHRQGAVDLSRLSYLLELNQT